MNKKIWIWWIWSISIASPLTCYSVFKLVAYGDGLVFTGFHVLLSLLRSFEIVQIYNEQVSDLLDPGSYNLSILSASGFVLCDEMYTTFFSGCNLVNLVVCLL